MGAFREIEILVMEKYPRTQAERRCAIERRMMDAVRDNYRKKLIDEFTRKAQVLDSVRPATEAN
jgi:hypothetical protein